MATSGDALPSTKRKEQILVSHPNKMKLVVKIHATLSTDILFEFWILKGAKVGVENQLT
jgi:hypothetical protein